MRRVFGLQQVPDELPWPVVTLGTFDGVHPGHQRILKDTVEWAAEQDGTAIAVTFRQAPRGAVSSVPTPCITSCRHRLSLLEDIGIDLAVVLEFTTELMQTPAPRFAQTLFCDKLHARGIQWGFNCRFGRDAEGDVELMRSLQKPCGFEVRVSQAVTLGEVPISSTAIRQAILRGDLEAAAEMLGREVGLLGTVVHGSGRGHDLGFATANLDLHHEAIPPPGIYACRAVLHGKSHIAVTNIGSCPTFQPPKPSDTVETHILDFDGDIRGEDIEVKFVSFLREESTFDSTEALIRQIENDIARTRQVVTLD